MNKTIKILFLLSILFFPLISALTLTDTTFFASETNYTIFVDSITLDNVTITSTSITFFNLTSVGSNFTNTNVTFDAIASFIGLDVGLTIRNINTSTDLFTSSLGNQDYNATFTSEQIIRIMDSETYICSLAIQSFLNLTLLFFVLAILSISLLIFSFNKKFSLETNPKTLIIIFVGLIFSVVFIQILANGVVSFCG